MTASLGYFPEPAPSAEVVDAIIKEAANLTRVADHWNEPYMFVGTTAHALQGHTKVSVSAYSAPSGELVLVERADDAFMMAQEVEMLLRGIVGWARAYKLHWRIEFDGHPVGSVDPGGHYSDDLRNFIGQLHEFGSTPNDPELVKARRASIRAKYSDLGL